MRRRKTKEGAKGTKGRRQTGRMHLSSVGS